MALEPRRVERWLRDAYPTQEVHDRVEWHAEGSMTQCFVRLDDRVVLIHLVGEGDRTVLKGRLEIPLDLWKPDPRKPHLATRRHPIPPPHQRGHLQQPRRSSARIRTQLGGALAHRNACRHDATRTQTRNFPDCVQASPESQSNSRRPTEPAKKELHEISATLERCEADLGRALGEDHSSSFNASSIRSIARSVLLPRVQVTVRKSCAPWDQPPAAGRG